MPGSLACILSYGLMCTPAEKEVEVPTPTPLTPANPAVPQPGTDPAPPKGAASLVLAKVQSFYDGTKDLQADFTQTYVHSVYGTKTISKGKLRVKKPGKMVWDYAEKANADYWVDGKRLWVVERELGQVLKKDLAGSDIAGAEKFLFGGKELIQDFQIKMASATLEKRYGMPKHTAIRLKPKKKNSHYRELMLVVDDATGRVDAFVVRNQDNSTNHFKLNDLSRNNGLGDDQFKFKKPKGYTEISG